ncbi:MAG: ABC transporter ATP-binding protein [Phycisphaerales bacterium]|nr:MAG: ABC transporter ATP-binding protein [Phycisphaerales bacterium]
MTVSLSTPAATAIPGAAAAVRAEKLTKAIDDKTILKDINLDISAGRYVALLGANGAGKTTLLKILATLVAPSGGVLKLFGQTVRRDSIHIRSRLGLIGHGAMLYRDLSARENLVFFGRLYGVADAPGRAAELLKFVDLAPRANDPVKTFSRGMMQRVSIARALMHNPDLLLADEPFSGLDAPSCRMLEEMLSRLHGQGKTVVLANHEISQSLRLAEQAVVLRKGRVVLDEPASSLDPAAVLAEVSAR